MINKSFDIIGEVNDHDSQIHLIEQVHASGNLNAHSHLSNDAFDLLAVQTVSANKDGKEEIEGGQINRFETSSSYRRKNCEGNNLEIISQGNYN